MLGCWRSPTPAFVAKSKHAAFPLRCEGSHGATLPAPSLPVEVDEVVGVVDGSLVHERGVLGLVHLGGAALVVRDHWHGAAAVGAHPVDDGVFAWPFTAFEANPFPVCTLVHTVPRLLFNLLAVVEGLDTFTPTVGFS